MINKTIVVVGASRGIGRAIVQELIQSPNFTVYALSRNIEQMTQELAPFSNLHCHAIDLTSEDFQDQLKEIFHDTIQIDILINNAGFLVNKPFSQLTKNDLLTSYQTNILGVIQTVQVLMTSMHQGGHIVNISSMGAFQGSVKFAGLSAYSSSKAALVNFTELFAEEFKDTNIKMNCLCLGAVQTEMLNDAFPGYIAQMNAENMARYICHFALHAHQWMNGKIIPVSLSTP